MMVTVTMWGNLRRFLPDGQSSAALQVADTATIEDMTIQLEAKHEVWAVALNGKVVPFSTPLSPGDHVICFDHIHGG
jgi:sulfur carrier protein ThiS